MNKKDALQFYDQYASSMSSRIDRLRDHIRGTAGFERWSNTYDDVSLVGLALWVESVVEKRDLSAGELHDATMCIPKPLSRVLSGTIVTLSDTSWSYCLDVSMYIGSCVIRKHRDVGIVLGRGMKSGPYYNKPIIATSDGKFQYDIIGLVVAIVYDYLTMKISIDFVSEVERLDRMIRGRH